MPERGGKAIWGGSFKTSEFSSTLTELPFSVTNSDLQKHSSTLPYWSGCEFQILQDPLIFSVALDYVPYRTTTKPNPTNTGTGTGPC
jgi:hypothetical protein